MEQFSLVKEAIKAVPAVKFALGIAGVAAAVALIAGMFTNLWVAIFGTIIMLGLMCVLLVFSSIARQTDSAPMQVMAYIMAGFFILSIMATTSMLFFCVFLNWPKPVRCIWKDNLAGCPSSSGDVKPPESHIERSPEDVLKTLSAKKKDWVARVFEAQAPSGGIRQSPENTDDTAQVWATAQCLTGVLASDVDLGPYLPQIRNAFAFIETSRRTQPYQGWNLYGGDKNEYTITEISGWVTIAYIYSLTSPVPIWNESEKPEILSRVGRELDEIIRRQDPDGAFRPIRDQRPGFSRTYSTVMALWGLLEARLSPQSSGIVGNRYDGQIRSATVWLMHVYRPGQGWVPNPNRTGQTQRFVGLTAQALFVLSRGERAPALAYIRNNSIYKSAERELVANSSLGESSIDEANTSVPDPDIRFPGTDFQAEGSTFLWFPWTLAELTHLSSDESLTADDRQNASVLFGKILSHNADRIANYVEANDLMYFLGENLFCSAIATGTDRR